MKLGKRIGITTGFAVVSAVIIIVFCFYGGLVAINLSVQSVVLIEVWLMLIAIVWLLLGDSYFFAPENVGALFSVALIGALVILVMQDTDANEDKIEVKEMHYEELEDMLPTLEEIRSNYLNGTDYELYYNNIVDKKSREADRVFRMEYPAGRMKRAHLQTLDNGEMAWVAPINKFNMNITNTGVPYAVVVVAEDCSGQVSKYEEGEIPPEIITVTRNDAVKMYNQSNNINEKAKENECAGCFRRNNQYWYCVETWSYVEGKQITGFEDYTSGIQITGSEDYTSGILLVNANTNEYYHYSFSSQTEVYSCMDAIKNYADSNSSEVLSYNMTLVGGIPTYIAALGDEESGISGYAMSDMCDSSILVSAVGFDECVREYYETLGVTGIRETELVNISITVQKKELLYIDGTLYMYLWDSDGQVYKTSFSDGIIAIELGDVVTVAVLPINEQAVMECIIKENG